MVPITAWGIDPKYWFAYELGLACLKHHSVRGLDKGFTPRLGLCKFVESPWSMVSHMSGIERIRGWRSVKFRAQFGTVLQEGDLNIDHPKY